MKDEKKLDLVLERFYNRFNKYNTKVLEELGNVIKQFDGLSPSQAHRLAQELKYSNNVDDLLKELSRLSGKSLKEMETLFDEVAKQNVGFSEIYYDVKGKEYIPYEENDRIRRYVDTVKLDTEGTFLNLSRQTSIGFSIKEGKDYTFKPLENVYRDLIDEAVFNVSTGVFDYQSSMRSTLRQLADSGIKVHEDKIAYKNYSRRIDTSVRQAILTGLRKINIGIQKQIGEELGTDGVEISAHPLCALDHLEYQGRQYSNDKFEDIQSNLERPIGDLGYNCRHFIFNVILGIQEPNYTDEELEEMKNETLKEITYNGKKYNMYEATQIQRQLETAIRRQKDRQIVSRASGDTQEAMKAQSKINQLLDKYTDFSNKAGLEVYKNRISVSGYRKIKVNDIKTNSKSIIYKNADDKIIQKMQKNSNELYNKYERNDYKDLYNLKQYTSGYGIYKDITKGLYENKGDINSMFKSDQNIVNSIDKIINKNTIGEDLILYRGTSAEYYYRYTIGDEITMYNYVSTSLKENKANDFIRSVKTYNKQPLKMIIIANKNTKGIYIGENTLSPENEYEVLLNRNTKYKITNIKDVDGIREMYMEVIK